MLLLLLHVSCIESKCLCLSHTMAPSPLMSTGLDTAPACLTRPSRAGLLIAGRCDYWGPFVNRAARFANSAARGGQIMVPAAVGRALVAALTNQTLSLEGQEPVLLVQPDFVPQQLKLRASKPWVPQSSGHGMRNRRSDRQRRTAEVPALALGVCDPGGACGLEAP